MDGSPEERWRRTQVLLLRLGEATGSAPLETIPRLVVEAVLSATGAEQAALFVRSGDRLVLHALAGSNAAAPALVAAANAAVEQSTANGAAVATALRLPDGLQGALVILLAPAATVPSDETEERLRLFAPFAAAALRTERALVGRRDAALATVHRLVARTAHELNNPLGGVKLYARLMEQRLAKAEDTYGEGLAQKITHAVDRLTVMIADLGGRGRAAETRPERVPVNTVLAEALAGVQERLTANSVEAATDLGKDAGDVLGDREEFRRAFSHLLINALDAMPSGGRLGVRTRRATPATVEVLIEDNGEGMDADTRAQAVELFFSTRLNAAGLGLAIVHATVEAHGGRIEVDSEPGRGTRVTVRLRAVER